ncbi:cation transporter [Vibrio sp.]|uniref:cation transporter n=1 Tax=Vibrio sp. TaxID=678 RepID=UPI003D0F2552
MQNEIVRVEQGAIRLGIIANAVMAVSGWVAYHYSGSQALLLDGNMSFILFLTSIVALKISAIKSHRSEKFPFGLFVTEALYALMKGLLLLGVIIAALTGNGSKVIQYLSGEAIAPIKTGIIIYYALAMVAICFALAFSYHHKNKQIQMASGMLKVDQRSSMIDGILSAATGSILVVIGFVPVGSKFDFLLYIGDAILVIILALLMLGQPVKIIKQAFIELVGGKLQNQQQYQAIKQMVLAEYDQQGIALSDYSISKTGSSYLIILVVSQPVIAAESNRDWQERKQRLKQRLIDQFGFVDLEIVVA